FGSGQGPRWRAIVGTGKQRIVSPVLAAAKRRRSSESGAVEAVSGIGEGQRPGAGRNRADGSRARQERARTSTFARGCAAGCCSFARKATGPNHGGHAAPPVPAWGSASESRGQLHR